MKTSLALILVLAAAPAFAADSSAPADGAAASSVPPKDQQPKPGTDNIGSAYAMNNFDTQIAADTKQREAEMNDAIKAREAEYEEQKTLETRQTKEKFEFLKKRVEERKAFERAAFEDWKKFTEKLRATAPAERNAAKLAFDRADLDARHKQDDDSRKLITQFMEDQQRERDQYWINIQKENEERERKQQASDYKSVKQANPQ